MSNLFSSLDKKECLTEITEKVFYILDQKDTYSITHSDSNSLYHVTVQNRTQTQSIYFLAIDHCLFDSSGIKRCDCLIHNQSIICFIEIKTVDFKGGNAARKAVKMQLEASIIYFKGTVDLSGLAIRAYMCVGRIEPTPIVSARDINDRVRFANIGAELFQGNIITLEG